MDTTLLLIRAKQAVKEVSALKPSAINSVLLKVADNLEKSVDEIIAANAVDLKKIPREDYRYDRLLLTPERIASIAGDMRKVATLRSPLRVLNRKKLQNGLVLKKVAVPFGVVGVVYEARPNVSADVFSLCFKSGNVTVLKGGHDAEETNRAIASVIRHTLSDSDITPDAVVLLDSSRQATATLLSSPQYVDLLIPRGSKGLIEYIRENAQIPVIETGAGVCHCYVHHGADTAMAAKIVHNAKTRRVSVCNALDCLIIDKSRLSDLPEICSHLSDKNVVIHADAEAFEALSGKYPAHLLKVVPQGDTSLFGTEFLSHRMAVRTVADIDEALDHIAAFGSGHSEAIVTCDLTAAASFTTSVDAACVYHNASTAFTDGAQFGMGAEIGISTQKLHARGPMALKELTTYKWIITGSGQTRP